MKLLVLALVIVTSSAVALAGPTAEQLYDQGQRAYDHGDWPTAIAQWQLSYDLSGAPGLLFNLAQAHRLVGDCALAIASYRRFIELEPKSEQRGLADDFLRELEPTCRPSAPSAEPPPQQHGRTLKVAGLATGGAGVAALVGGIVLGAHASTLGDRVSAACTVSCDWTSEKKADAAGRRDAAIGYALDAVGAAAIVGGAVMYYFGDHAGEITIVPRSREGGAVVSWSGSW